MRRKGVIAFVLALAAASAWASSVIGLSVEDQARLSQLVVVGEVLNQRGVNHPVNGLETAVTLKVTDVLKGEARKGQAITFHSRSGQKDGEISEAIGEAVFHSGQKVLVFIESVDGRLYNLGLSMGVWNVNEDKTGATTFTRALQDGLSIVGEQAVEMGPVSYGDMKGRVSYAGRNPRFDNEVLRAQVHGKAVTQ
ncbi:MAG TPA: hypothetical protein VFW45_05400 [Candidatus Polarisedimenticolia bacterium]|nr:hypothetical protein [Candidatus Polarisedimenticolia bacterium]